jgi:hypothetical protein
MFSVERIFSILHNFTISNSDNQLAVTEGSYKELYQAECLLCPVRLKSVLAFVAPGITVRDVVYLEKNEEFLMWIFIRRKSQ